MVRSHLCNNSDVYIHVKGTVEVTNTAAQGAAPSNRKKNVIFENYAPFISCISSINNTQVDDGHGIDVVMPLYSLLEYDNVYSKTSGSLWQYFRDEPASDDNNVVNDFPDDNNNSNSFKFKQKITGKTTINGTKDVEIMVPLKYLSNFWRTSEIPLINCEISLMLTWSKNCF